MKKPTIFVLLTVTMLLSVSFSFGPSTGAEEGEIPFRMLGHMMMVKVKINDSPKEFNFIVDTGGATFVSKEVADEMGLKQMGPQAKISTLHLPGFQIANIFCFTTFDFSHLKSLSVPVHGIIGSTLLERYRVTFDFLRSVMTLSGDQSELETPKNGLHFKFRNHPVNNAPLIECKINGKTLEAMIDTGQPNAFVLPIETFEDYAAGDFAGFFKSKGLMEKWPDNKVDYNYLVRLNKVELGGLTFDKILCLFGDLPSLLSMPLIGTDLLTLFRIIIDFPTDEMVMVPISGFRMKANLFSVGVNVVLSEENEVIVGGIWENSPADKAGLLVGDRVFSFRSIKIRPDNLLDLQNALRDDEVGTIELGVISKGEKRTVLLKKTMLF